MLNMSYAHRSFDRETPTTPEIVNPFHCHFIFQSLHITRTPFQVALYVSCVVHLVRIELVDSRCTHVRTTVLDSFFVLVFVVAYSLVTISI